MLGFEQSHTKNSSLQDNQNFITQAIIPIEYTNAIAYGQTGSGKSTGFILPNIINRLQNNHNLIIYDYKSTLINSVLTLLYERDMLDALCELGVKWGEGMNVLGLLEIDEILSWLKSFDTSKDSYWINSATTLFEMLYKTLCYIKELCDLTGLDCDNFASMDLQDLSFSDIYAFVDEYMIGALCDSIVALLEIIEVSHHKTSILEFYQDKLYESYVFLYKFSSNYLLDTSSSSGNKGIIGVLKNAISSVANAEFLNDKSNSLLSKFSKKLILIIYPSKLDYFAVSLLNSAILKLLKSNQVRSSTVFIDEAHKILSKGFMPEVSVCREYNFEYILSTQDQSQIEHIYANLYDHFVSNIAHQISFYNPLNPICDSLKTFEFRILELSKNKSNSTSFANAYFYDKNLLKIAKTQYFKRYFQTFYVYLRSKPLPLEAQNLVDTYLESTSTITDDVYLVEDDKKSIVKLIPRTYKSKHQSSITSLLERLSQSEDTLDDEKNTQVYDKDNENIDIQNQENQYESHHINVLRQKLLRTYNTTNITLSQLSELMQDDDELAEIFSNTMKDVANDIMKIINEEGGEG